MTNPATTQQPQIIFPAGAQVVLTDRTDPLYSNVIYTVEQHVSNLGGPAILNRDGMFARTIHPSKIRAATVDDFQAAANATGVPQFSNSSPVEPLPVPAYYTDGSLKPDIETLPNGAKQSKLGHWWNLPHAMLAVAEVMNKGHITYDKPDATPDKPNFAGIPAWSSIQHAITHLMLHQVGNTDEPHLHHAAARILMAIEVIEGGHDKT